VSCVASGQLALTKISNVSPSAFTVSVSLNLVSYFYPVLAAGMLTRVTSNGQERDLEASTGMLTDLVDQPCCGGMFCWCRYLDRIMIGYPLLRRAPDRALSALAST
jgi:hypothetical protein